MITFKQYYIINEALITRSGDENIPVKELLLSNNLSELPNVKPYGFWVDRSGNFIDVYMSGSKNNGGHAGVAKAIIQKALSYKIAKDTLTTEEEDELIEALKPGKFGGVYNILLTSGFMHVVLAGNVYYYKTSTGIPTSSQSKFLRALYEKYETKAEYASEIF